MLAVQCLVLGVTGALVTAMIKTVLLQSAVGGPPNRGRARETFTAHPERGLVLDFI